MDNHRQNGPVGGGGMETENFNNLIEQERKPNLKVVMRLYLLVFLILLVLGSIAQGLSFEIGMIVTQWVFILLPALWFLTRYRVDRFSFVRLRPLKAGFIPVIILLSVSFWLLNMVIAAGLVSGLMELGYEPIMVLEPPETFQNYLVYLFVIAISAGICEEVLFRGTIMPAMEEHGLGPAIVFSSLLFAIFHLSFLNLISTFMLGAVIAVIVIKSGSLWGGVLYHMLNNFYAVTYLYLAGQEEAATEVDPQAYLALIPLFILALGGAYAGLKLLQKNSVVKPLLEDRDRRWFPRGWFSWLLVFSLLLFLIMALLEFAIGFGWFGLEMI